MSESISEFEPDSEGFTVRLLSREKAAKKIDMSTKTVDRLNDDESEERTWPRPKMVRLPGRKKKYPRYREDEIDKYIDSLEEG